ncbi:MULTISPECIES: hypothetical protein [Oerskovia]|uniref:Uncharacterized protein n=2 Tax=Oerskovia TaxID=162491 RepID=A0ABR8UX98_9CELL|nr:MULTISPECIES: hypothetical protein [Oerskovia]MBD7997177.1 hypothetical protein [Oerskovia gallyi]MBM7497943.1 hypothetical protein [Oerskovia paurometabola]
MSASGPPDARGRLVEDPFDHRVTASGTVLAYRGGRLVATISGAQAARLIAALETADEDRAQHLLARATGNYRRGNERR